jgi:hypothetical protein
MIRAKKRTRTVMNKNVSTLNGPENTGTTKVAQAQTYTCPMHPDVKSDKPGKCPKCGMNLVVKK